MSKHLLLVTLAILVPTTCFADVKLPMIFGDHMVLQQSVKLPVWGTAAPGEVVTVVIGNDTAKATAGSDGNWRVDLDPLPVGGAPLKLTVTGKNTLTFQDVVIGDVWICSGQSNMDFGILMADHGKEEAAKATDPDLRLFFVTRSATLTPQDDLARIPEGHAWGKWQVCSPETVLNGNWGGFSAVGYFFARNIRQFTQHPVGMIQSTWGGTPVQAWSSLQALQGNPAAQHLVESFTKMSPEQSAIFPVVWADYVAAMKKWNEEKGPAADQAALQSWQTAAAQAQAAGQPAPPRPQVTRPHDPGNIGTPTTLFNGMINPLIPYALKGVIWYQGESNEGNASEYASLFTSMITDWRQRWNQGDFPFLFVQIANFYEGSDPNIGNWAIVRENQAKALSLPNTGMATAIDIGDPGNIHPKDKIDVAARLALVAQHVAYGQNIVYAGPTFDCIKIEGNKIRVSYKNIGGGLIISAPPGIPDEKNGTLPSTLIGFEIAGADKKWVPAQAFIDGQTVLVSSDRISAPVAVRYDWAGNPIGDPKVEGNAIRLSYVNIVDNPFLSAPSSASDGKPAAQPAQLTDFEICGADKKWAPAKAIFDGQTALVSSDKVAAPVAVRYRGQGCPIGNLYNKEGLPAFPFRSGD